MTHVRIRGDMRRRLRSTQHGLNQITRVTARFQGCANNGPEVLSRPRSRLGAFDNDRRVGEKGGHQRAYEVMERVILAYVGGDDF